MPTNVDQPGSWTIGPTFPMENGQQLIAKDAPASLLPNGSATPLSATVRAGVCARFFAGINTKSAAEFGS